MTAPVEPVGPAGTTAARRLAAQVGPYFGEFGGRFVPEALVAALDELDTAYRAA